jgi:hypothetical protein
MYNNNDDLGFLSLWNTPVRHHCVLLPSLYAINNCSLLLKYFEFLYQIAPNTTISSPDFLFFTEFSEYKTPLVVDDVRDVIIRFAQNTSFGKQKSIIIEKIEEASTSALNALLKIIEEPPQNTYFYLIYSNIDSVLPTIRSRSMVITENINSYEKFVSLTKFLEILDNFEVFKESGYNFEIYNTLVNIKQWSFEKIYEMLQYKVEETTQTSIMLFLEHQLQEYAQRKLNFYKFERVSNLLQNFFVLSKSIRDLNTNRQAALIQLTEEVHVLVA